MSVPLDLMCRVCAGVCVCVCALTCVCKPPTQIADESILQVGTYQGNIIDIAKNLGLGYDMVYLGEGYYLDNPDGIYKTIVDGEVYDLDYNNSSSGHDLEEQLHTISNKDFPFPYISKISREFWDPDLYKPMISIYEQADPILGYFSETVENIEKLDDDFLEDRSGTRFKTKFGDEFQMTFEINQSKRSYPYDYVRVMFKRGRIFAQFTDSYIGFRLGYEQFGDQIDVPEYLRDLPMYKDYWL